MSRLAIIVQEQTTRETLTTWVEDLGHGAAPYKCGLHAESALRRQPAALVIAELSAREVDGLALTRAVRQFSDVPILIVSRTLDDVEHVLALKAGADQTMSWPASRSVAMATVEAMLDRHQRLTCCREPVTSAIAAGHLSLDPECHVASWRGRDLKLTANEFAILRRLSHRPGTVRSREQLMGPEGAQRLPERTIDSHIKRIRKKFRAVDPAFDRIETMYGLGYRFVAEDPLDAPAPIALARSFRLGGAGKGGA